MLCLGCQTAWREMLCGRCHARLVAAGPRLIAGRMVARSAYRHEDLARALIHDFKYRGVVAVARLMASPLAELVPGDGRVLVPVPRVIARRLSLGIDPAFELARALGRVSGLPVASLLRPAMWQPNHAGQGRGGRAAVAFRTRRAIPPGVVLVDDVLTTGTTLRSALYALGSGVVGAVTATASGV